MITFLNSILFELGIQHNYHANHKSECNEVRDTLIGERPYSQILHVDTNASFTTWLVHFDYYFKLGCTYCPKVIAL